MGSQDFYPEEGPVREVSVEGFWIDEHPVTVAEFRRFATATGHVTTAELAPPSEDYPDADPELLVPGSLVFQQPPGPVSLDDFREWWQWTPGAFWRRPEGPGSNTGGREHHPVVHVSYSDAAAYADWAGKELATEAEWERAARGGLERKVFAWGDEFMPDGKLMANVWQGEFPWHNLRTPVAPRTTAIRSFPPNGFGLYDMTGNTWEWTSEVFSMPTADAGPTPKSGCCTGGQRSLERPIASAADTGLVPERVIKGGSHLCAANYCLRYRPAARQRQTIDTSTAHIGFRCVIR
jgi:formylglycine-generating enzyme